MAWTTTSEKTAVTWRWGVLGEPAQLHAIEQAEEATEPLGGALHGDAIAGQLENLDGIPELGRRLSSPGEGQQVGQAAEARGDLRKLPRPSRPQREDAGEDHGFIRPGKAPCARLDLERAVQVLELDQTDVLVGRRQGPEAALGEKSRDDARWQRSLARYRGVVARATLALEGLLPAYRTLASTPLDDSAEASVARPFLAEGLLRPRGNCGEVSLPAERFQAVSSGRSGPQRRVFHGK